MNLNSFKSAENIRKKEGGPDRSVSNNKFSSVTLNELDQGLIILNKDCFTTAYFF